MEETKPVDTEKYEFEKADRAKVLAHLESTDYENFELRNGMTLSSRWNSCTVL